MKRLLILLALTGFGTALACSDEETPSESEGEDEDEDDDDDDEDDEGGSTGATDGGKDSGRADASNPRDSGTSLEPRGVQIENLGDPCEDNSGCEGAGATCATDFFQAQPLPGGMCTADCRSNSECGENGACPLAGLNELGEMLGLGATLGTVIPSICLRSCDPETEDPCGREDFECNSFADALGPQIGGFLRGVPGADQPYCLPPITVIAPLPDGGPGVPPDAGTSSDGGQTAVDASSQLDSGRTDAGRDARADSRP